MENNTIKEYEILRGEMLSVKECITNYIGFVLGGSGIASISMIGIVAARGKDLDGIVKLENLLALFSMTFLFISLLISFVLLILYYKFTSHNRFAGYCNLIGMEKHLYGNNMIKSIIGWENVLEIQREYSSNLKLYVDLIDNLFVAVDKDKLKGLLNSKLNRKNEVAKGKFSKGILFIIKAMFFDYKARSWAFPPYVVSMFFFLVSWFYIIGLIIYLYLYGLYLPYDNINIQSLAMAIVISISITQVFLWRKYIHKLDALMDGANSVSSSCILLLPARVKYLNRWKIVPSYEL